MIKRLLLAASVLLVGTGAALAFLIAGPTGGGPVVPLPNGTYLITSGANSVDAGGVSSPWVSLQPTTSGTTQRWLWNGSTLVAQGVTGGAGGTTFDPARISGLVTLSNGNLTATSTADGDAPAFTLPTHTTGKWVFRFTANLLSLGTPEVVGVGIGNTSAGVGGYLGNDTNSFAMYDDGVIYLGNATIATGLSFTTGGLIDCVFDIPNKLAWFRVNNGPWRGNGTGTADPTAGTNGFNASALTGTTFSPAINLHTNTDQMTSSAAPVVSGATAWAVSGGPPGTLLVDNGAGVATIAASGNTTWSVFQSGAGYKARNLTTNNYLTATGSVLSMSATQTVWNFQPFLTMTATPSAPSITDQAALGSQVSALAATWSNAASFAGTFMFVSPNYDSDTFAISGSNMVVASNGAGVGALGGTTENTSLAAIQMDTNSADLTISNAGAGAPLKTTSNLWSWGPTQAGRQIGGGSFAGGNVLYRNGVQIWSGDQMEVANGGQFYVHNPNSNIWFRWNGSALVNNGGPP